MMSRLLLKKTSFYIKLFFYFRIYLSGKLKIMVVNAPELSFDANHIEDNDDENYGRKFSNRQRFGLPDLYQELEELRNEHQRSEFEVSYK